MKILCFKTIQKTLGQGSVEMVAPDIANYGI